MIPHADPKDDLTDTDSKFRFSRTLKIPWYDQILLNRPLKVTLALLLTAVAAPLLIYNFYFFTTFDLPPSDGFSIGTCLIQRENRIPCGIGSIPQEQCHGQCCYDLSSNFCFHRVPSRFSFIMDQPWNEGVVVHPRIATVPYNFQNSLTTIKLSIDEKSESHVILRLYDARNISYTGERLETKNYTYEVSSPEMGVVVNSTQGTIFNMARGPMIASENIWEISFILTNETMYGLGEIPLKENTTKILYNHKGGVISIPLIFARNNVSYHGLLIESSDPTEVSIHGENRIVVRSITNLGFTFHLFVGPTPKDVMNDALGVIGKNHHMDYWMLGAHICNEVPDEDLSSFLTSAASERIPYESHCGHGPIVFQSNECKTNITNTEVDEGADLVKRRNKRYVPHVSPFVRYHEEKDNETEAEESTEQPTRNEEIDDIETMNTCGILPTYEDIMFREPQTLEIYKGLVNDEEVVYPNYEEATKEYMSDLWPYDVIPDGVLLENNWPYDEREKILNETGLPYFNENFKTAFNKTPQWNLVFQNGTEKYLFKHQKFGNHFANAFTKIVNETMIWSSSQWMNGKIGINRQNVDTSWTNLRKELVEAALGGISGHWFWSTPICGDTENFDMDSHANLCVKWYMAATYFPMIKIHSKTHPRHPLGFTGTHKARIIEALNHRLYFLPYFYTTLQEGPLLRPMFYQYPATTALASLSSQFSVGDALLIVPNLEPSQSHVHVWMPPGIWYELWSGLRLNAAEGEAVTLTTTEADFLTLIHGGSILPLQKNVRDSALETRWLSDFSIIIALNCGNETCEASGHMFITDNMTLNFEANAQNFTITAEGDDFDPICDWFGGTWAYDIREINVYGLDDDLNNFDYHRKITTFIDLCVLETRDSIVTSLV